MSQQIGFFWKSKEQKISFYLSFNQTNEMVN